VADQQRLNTRHDRTPLFFSAFSISWKLGFALAVGVALPLVGALGFDPQAAQNSTYALNGLLIVFAAGPALAHLASALLLRGFTLDEAEVSIVQAELRRTGTSHA